MDAGRRSSTKATTEPSFSQSSRFGSLSSAKLADRKTKKSDINQGKTPKYRDAIEEFCGMGEGGDLLECLLAERRMERQEKEF